MTWAVLMVLVAVALLVVYRRATRLDQIPEQPAQKSIAIKTKVVTRSMAPFAYSMNAASNTPVKEGASAMGWTAIPSTGDPEQDRLRLRRNNEANIDAMYADMYRMLGFSPEQAAAFRELRLDRQERVSRLLKQSMHHMADDRTNAALALDVINEQEDQTYEAALRQTFGDATARQINTYDADRRIRLLTSRIGDPNAPLPADVQARTKAAIRTLAIGAEGEIAITPSNRDLIMAEAKDYLTAAQAEALRTELDRLVRPRGPTGGH